MTALANGPTPPTAAPAAQPRRYVQSEYATATVLLPFVGGGGPEAAAFDAFGLAVELCALIRAHAQQRREHLAWDSTVARIAERRAADMRLRQYIAHVDPDGAGPNWHLRYGGVRLPDYYDKSDAGNNVESIRLGPPNAADAMAALIASPAHADHVLGRGFFGGQTHIGVAVVPDWNVPFVQAIFVVLICHVED